MNEFLLILLAWYLFGVIGTVIISHLDAKEYYYDRKHNPEIIHIEPVHTMGSYLLLSIAGMFLFWYSIWCIFQSMKSDRG